VASWRLSNHANRRRSRGHRPALWVHELKHDGYRLMVRRDGERVRCFTKNGHDWTDRFSTIVDAAKSKNPASDAVRREREEE